MISAIAAPSFMGLSPFFVVAVLLGGDWNRNLQPGKARRAPDAAQRHKRVYARLRRAMALRGAVRCRAGAVTDAGAWDGPGSAKHHAAKSGALHRARDTES